MIGENDNLDAFSLAVGAGEKEAEIKELEDKIIKTEQDLSLIQKQLVEKRSEDEGSTLFDEYSEKTKLFNEQARENTKFL